MRVTVHAVSAVLLVALVMTGLALGPASAPAAAQVEQRYLVLGTNSALPGDFEALIAAVGGRVIMVFSEIGVALVASANPAFRTAAAALPGVQSVVPDGTMGVEGAMDALGPDGVVMDGEGTVADGVPSVNPQQWHLFKVAADQVWSRGFVGQDVTVAVLDTGIDYWHQELAGQVDLARSVSIIPREERDMLGRPVPAGLAPFADVHLHGTHVASVIAGKGVLSTVTGFSRPGVAPKARLVAVKVMDRTGQGPESAVIAGILYAGRIGVDIINMSLGFILPRREPGLDDDDEDDRWVQSQQLEAMERAVRFARKQGVLMVASAGNDATDWDDRRAPCPTLPSLTIKECVKGPAGLRHVAGVSATTPIDTLAPFSNFGRTLVDVAAPGTGIWGAGNTLYFRPMRHPQTGQLLFAYIAMSGTSQAAATTSGIAALIDSTSNGRLSADRIFDRLTRGTDDLGRRGRDSRFGSGRVNALKSVTQGPWTHHDDDDEHDDDD